MSSSALPPLANSSTVGSREERDDHRTPKVKPLPLMLSSRAPLIQASRADAPGSPSSPTGQHTGGYRSKFTRIRGFQGPGGGGPGQSLALEGAGLLHHQQQQQQSSGGGAHPHDAADGLGAHSWDCGAQSPVRGPGNGGVIRPGSGSGGGARSGGPGGAVAELGPPFGGGSSGGGSPGGAAVWAARRGSSSSRNVVQLAREIPALEGVGHAIGGGSSGGAGGSGGGGVARSVSAAAFPKYFMPGPSTYGSPGGTAARPETAPPPASPFDPADPLAATFPSARNHSPGPSPGMGTGVGFTLGTVIPAPINPPLQASSLPTGGAGDAMAAPVAAAADAMALPPPGVAQYQHQFQPHQQQPLSNASQLLQRLYRTNRTPPAAPQSISDGLPDAASPSPNPSLRHSAAPAAASGIPSPALSSLPSARSAATAAPGGGGGSGGGSGAASPQRPASLLPSPSLASSHLAAASAASFSSGAIRQRTRAGAAGTLADLSAALQKSIAAGMGELDLRATGTWGHPEIQQRLLKGPLAPEALKGRYRMAERDIISLYRLLYSYSVGFFSDVESLLDCAVSDRASGASIGLVAGSALRQELLENVFRAYAALWDEALMVVFDSEMTTMLADKRAAMQALDAGAVELESLRREKEQLQSRLEEFVKQNVDNMMATRHMHQATTKLEGEVFTLHNANEQLISNLARHAVQVATLERQLDAARVATDAAEARAAGAEAHLADLKAIVAEQNAALSAQFFQIKELERTSSELQETVRNLNRRRAAVLGLLSGTTPEPSDPGVAPLGTTPGSPQHVSADGTVAHPPGSGPSTAAGGTTTTTTNNNNSNNPGAAGSSPRAPGGGGGDAASAAEGALADLSLLDPEELGRLLADKTRAFNLMHADFVVKMHELDEQRSVNATLRREVADMQAAVRRSEAAAAESSATADKYRAKWEEGRMVVEDLEEANRRLVGKNAELVRSYWPLMARLKEAEAEAARCREEAARDREAAARDRAESDLLRSAAEETRAALAELEERRAEADSHELELPRDLLAALSEHQVSALRRFARSCHRRVAHLNAQVVALVDQVTALRVQLQTGGRGGGGGGAAAAAAVVAGGSGGAAGAADAAEVSELRSALAVRDKWLSALSKAMSSLLSQMENLMARDWETCSTLRLEQKKRNRRAVKAARHAAQRAAGLEASESEPVSPERSTTSVAMSYPSRGPSSTQVVPTVPEEGEEGQGDGASGADGGGGDGGDNGTPPPPGQEGSATSTAAGPATASAAVVSAEPSAAVAGEASSSTSLASSERRRREGAVQAPASGEYSNPNLEYDNTAAGAAGAGDGGGDDDDDDAEDEGDPAFSVACGRLAQLMGTGGSGDSGSWVERTPQLVALDRGFERLADSAERLIEWSEGLLRRKEQTSTFAQVKQKLDTVVRQLDAATAELTTLRPTAEALRHSVRGYEVKLKEMTSALASTKQRADTAEARLETTEAQLALVAQQLEEVQAAQKLLETEYWKAKDVALDAEVTTGELKAGRMRALEAAAKALASVSGLEREARENHDQRVVLEADLVGYKAWVRHMEQMERKYRATLKDLATATSGCEERDRRLAELADRIVTLEHQLRFKAVETASLESRVKALSTELVEERRTGRAALSAARTSTAAQLDAAIRQAGAAEAEAVAQGERVAVLEARLADAARSLEAAQAAAEAAEAALTPVTRERDRLRAHIAASQPLLRAMDRAASAIGQRLALLEDTVQQQGPPPSPPLEGSGGGGEGSEGGSETRGSGGDDGGGGDGGVGVVKSRGLGSLDDALGRLVFAVDGALDAVAAVAAEAAGDDTPALLAGLEGLVTQLLSTLSKGGTEPLQSLAVLKAQLARDDKELATLRATMAEMRAAYEYASRQAAEQRTAAQTAAAAAAAASAAAERDGRRAEAAEAALRLARSQVEALGHQLVEARQAADSTRRQLDRLQRRAAELDSDVAAARNQRRHHETQAAAAAQQCTELKRRVDDTEAQAARDEEAARDARERAAAAEAAAAAAAVRVSELEAVLEAERRDAARLRGEAAAAVAAAAEARARAVELEQQALEMQAKYADIIRHDEAVEERLRHALFDAEAMRKRASEATAEAAQVNAQYEALQQRAWQLQVALQAKQGEKEEALRELVDVTHGAVARKLYGAPSVKHRAEATPCEMVTSFKASRTVKE